MHQGAAVSGVGVKSLHAYLYRVTGVGLLPLCLAETVLLGLVRGEERLGGVVSPCSWLLLLGLVRMPLDEAIGMVMRGDIRDSKTICGLLLARDVIAAQKERA